MQYNICSISFRHELVSIRNLVRFAHLAGFSGIELWGVHGVSLLRNNPLDIARIVNEMKDVGICVSMISDYLDLLAEPDFFAAEEIKWREKISLARLFKTNKIRIFCGNKGSAAATRREWELCITRLKHMADLSAAYGIYTVIETHPGTYADCLDSTIRLIKEIEHEYVRINLDFLHLWEAGCHPIEAYQRFKPWTINYHLKNVSNRDCLPVFLPDNVYSPSGQRDGITSLADGLIDYAGIIHVLESDNTPYSASLEWFGNEPFSLLKAELQWLKNLENPTKNKISHISY